MEIGDRRICGERASDQFDRRLAPANLMGYDAKEMPGIRIMGSTVRIWRKIVSAVTRSPLRKC